MNIYICIYLYIYFVFPFLYGISFILISTAHISHSVYSLHSISYALFPTSKIKLSIFLNSFPISYTLKHNMKFISHQFLTRSIRNLFFPQTKLIRYPTKWNSLLTKSTGNRLIWMSRIIRHKFGKWEVGRDEGCWM